MVAIIILAAGASRRLGQPKQLLSYKNISLLRHAVNCALAIKDVRTLVVTGAEKELMTAELSGLDAAIVVNEAWAAGLSTSITAGLAAALNDSVKLRGCIFAVCDQPFLSTALLRQIMAAAKQSGKGIVAARYGDTNGTPVYFGQKYFEELRALTADEGAKRIVNRHTDDLATIDFPQGAIDIDTIEDYNNLPHAD